jgi:diguanylate cyclase (GGDEF)-like protein
MWKCIHSTGRWQGEIWNRRKSGEIYPEWLSITAIRGASGKMEHYLAIFSDITLRKREERELYDLATHDALTGLPNRYFFSERFRHALVRAKRAASLVALPGPRRFRFNDVGTVAGTGLQAVAKRLKLGAGSRHHRAAGRDEFAVILELSRPRDAAATARKLLHALARPYLLEGHKAKLTASIGITVYPLDGEDVETLLKRADGAMYRAKTERRNDYRFWGDPALYSRAGAPTRRK